MVDAYVPERGDIVWVNLNSGKGHEQQGTRPAVILSPQSYNAKTGLALECPITSVVKGYVFEVPVKISDVTGVILADHVRTIDWKKRGLSFIESVDSETLQSVQEKLQELIIEVS